MNKPSNLFFMNAEKKKMPHYVKNFMKKWLWNANIEMKRARKYKILFALIATIALGLWAVVHPRVQEIPGLFSAEQFRIFFNVDDVDVSGIKTPIANMILWACIFRVLFGIIIGIADLIFYKKIMGRPFDWDAMVNMSIVNAIFIFTAIFSFMNPLFETILVGYENLIQNIPTIVHLNGPLALLITCLIGDFCFYWSHRWCHNIRFFWNLGHVHHHRNRNLSQLTFSVDPQALVINAAGGKAFMVVLLPLFMKLFSVNILDAGWLLLIAIAFDIITDPSHSPTLYYAELKFPPLRKLRYVFVTSAVHFIHHSREPRHDIKGGCNFAARFTIWDRLFGTYAEPPAYIPESGLFSDQTDYCLNPVRYLFYPTVRMFKELKQNKIKYWPKILFGLTTYNPPNPVDMPH
jgi:sterol desaturase/sphingolipid hydroxylase (fatty acid hydroxylase superfamily)